MGQHAQNPGAQKPSEDENLENGAQGQGGPQTTLS